jgi:hypothetical protein
LPPTSQASQADDRAIATVLKSGSPQDQEIHIPCIAHQKNTNRQYEQRKLYRISPFSEQRNHHWFCTETILWEDYLLAEFGHEATESVQIRGLFFLLIPTEIIDLHNNKKKLEDYKNVKEID